MDVSSFILHFGVGVVFLWASVEYWRLKQAHANLFQAIAPALLGPARSQTPGHGRSQIVRGLGFFEVRLKEEFGCPVLLAPIKDLQRGAWEFRDVFAPLWQLSSGGGGQEVLGFEGKVWNAASLREFLKQSAKKSAEKSAKGSGIEPERSSQSNRGFTLTWLPWANSSMDLGTSENPSENGKGMGKGQHIWHLSWVSPCAKDEQKATPQSLSVTPKNQEGHTHDQNGFRDRV